METSDVIAAVSAVIAAVALVGAGIGYWLRRRNVGTEREEESRAHITADGTFSHRTQLGKPSGSGNYEVILTNLGPSWAKHVETWLADKDEQAVTAEVVAGAINPSLVRSVTLNVPEEIWKNPVSLWIWVRWSDKSGGPYTERMNADVKLESV